jgi:ABC-type nickel/cobalt efflux system permease component RcnA
MLASMLAMPTLDLVVTLVWIGGLAIVVLAQAVLAWLAHRQATRAARMAARLAEATETPRPRLRVVRTANSIRGHTP